MFRLASLANSALRSNWWFPAMLNRIPIRMRIELRWRMNDLIWLMSWLTNKTLNLTTNSLISNQELLFQRSDFWKAFIYRTSLFRKSTFVISPMGICQFQLILFSHHTTLEHKSHVCSANERECDEFNFFFLYKTRLSNRQSCGKEATNDCHGRSDWNFSLKLRRAKLSRRFEPIDIQPWHSFAARVKRKGSQLHQFYF